MGKLLYKIINPSTFIEVSSLCSMFTYIILVIQTISDFRSLLTENLGEGFMESYRPDTSKDSICKDQKCVERISNIHDWLKVVRVTTMKTNKKSNPKRSRIVV